MKRFLTLGIRVVLCLAVSGCAGAHKELARPVAQLVIPIPCVDGVVAGTKDVVCEAQPKKTPNGPDLALCRGGVIIQYHCSKVAAK